MNVVAIIQARMSSSRLNGKVMKPLGGTTVLGCVVYRLSQVKSINRVVVATTNNVDDDVIVEWCIKHNIDYFRGDENNVLLRFFDCASHYAADTIVRVTSDNPLVDPEIVSQTIDLYIDSNADYAANNLLKSFPHGLDVEVLSFNMLSISIREAYKLPDLEHVTQFVRYRPDRFKLVNLKSDCNCHQIRVTLDESEDFQLISLIYQLLGNSVDFIKLKNLFKKFPALFTINNKVAINHLKYNQSQKII
jgi:spore coat polysaccharide biosynthesis protein SpsF